MKLTAVRFEKSARPAFLVWSGRMTEVPILPDPAGRKVLTITYSVSGTERGARKRARTMWRSFDTRAKWASDRVAAEAAYRARLQRTVEGFDDAVKAMMNKGEEEA